MQHQLQPRLESVDALPPLRAYFVFMLTHECIANSSSNRRLNTPPFPTPKSFLALNSLHLCHRTVLPLSVSLCQLCAHVTRIFAQLKSIKLHFRLNKLGPRFGCCLFHLLFPLSCRRLAVLCPVSGATVVCVRVCFGCPCVYQTTLSSCFCPASPCFQLSLYLSL